MYIRIAFFIELRLRVSRSLRSLANDEVEWNYVTIDDTVAEKGALTTNSGFCQPKQKSN